MNSTIRECCAITVMCCLFVADSNLQSEDKGKKPSEAEMRDILNSVEFRERRELIAMGSTAYDSYSLILKDPKSKPLHIDRIFSTLQFIQGDRSRFLPYAIAHLADANEGVRISAVALLAQIGNENSTAGLHVLLSDDSLIVSCAAAKTLSEIGTDNDLHAMNVWLKIYKPKNLTEEQKNSHSVVREKVTKYQGELKTRLDKEKANKVKKP